MPFQRCCPFTPWVGFSFALLGESFNDTGQEDQNTEGRDVGEAPERRQPLELAVQRPLQVVARHRLVQGERLERVERGIIP